MLPREFKLAKGEDCSKSKNTRAKVDRLLVMTTDNSPFWDFMNEENPCFKNIMKYNLSSAKVAKKVV